MAEEYGQAERRKSVTRIRLSQPLIVVQQLGRPVVVSQSAGFKEIGLPAAQDDLRQLGMPCVGRPQRRCGALRVPRLRQSGIGGQQRADLWSVAFPNRIEQLGAEVGGDLGKHQGQQ